MKPTRRSFIGAALALLGFGTAAKAVPETEKLHPLLGVAEPLNPIAGAMTMNDVRHIWWPEELVEVFIVHPDDVEAAVHELLGGGFDALTEPNVFEEMVKINQGFATAYRVPAGHYDFCPARHRALPGWFARKIKRVDRKLAAHIHVIFEPLPFRIDHLPQRELQVRYYGRYTPDRTE